MGFRLIYGRELSALADCFYKDYNAHSHGFFEHPDVVIPNLNIDQWLRMFLARKHGVSANLHTLFLEKAFRARLSKASTSMVSDLDIRLQIYKKLVENPELEKSISGRDHQYLHQTWSISKQIVRGFRNLTYHRPSYSLELVFGDFEKTIKKMSQGLDVESSQVVSETLRLYGEIMRHTENEMYFPLVLLKYIGSINTIENSLQKTDSALLLFANSQLSRLHSWVVLKMAKEVPVFVYQFSMVNFDDSSSVDFNFLLENTIEKPNDKSGDKDNGKSIGPDFSVPFMQWLSPGINYFQMLKELSKAENSPIEAIKINSKKSFLPPTVDFFSHAGIYREIEFVYDKICKMLKDDPELQLQEIAVLVPDIEKWLPAIDLVFLGNENPIPFNVSDTKATMGSLYFSAIILLLEIISRPFERTTLMKFLGHPLVMQKFSWDENDIQEILSQLEKFRFVNDQNSSWPRLSLYSALRRMALAYCLPPAQNQEAYDIFEGEAFANFSDDTFFNRVGVYLLDLWEINGSYEKEVDSLESLSKDRLLEIIDSFIALPQNDSREQSIRMSVINSVDTFYEAAQKQKIPVTAGHLCLYLNETLKEILYFRGHYLVSGVCFSSLAPMRPIPFKKVFILGLNEDDFPGKSTTDLLQLSEIPIYTKSDRLSDIANDELNRYIFLEALSSAQQEIIFSFHHIDIQTGKQKIGSPLLQTILSYINVEAERSQIKQTPLKGYGQKSEYLPRVDLLDYLILEKEKRESMLSPINTLDKDLARPEQSQKNFSFYNIKNLFANPLEYFLSFIGNRSFLEMVSTEEDSEFGFDIEVESILKSDLQKKIYDKIIEQIQNRIKNQMQTNTATLSKSFFKKAVDVPVYKARLNFFAKAAYWPEESTGKKKSDDLIIDNIIFVFNAIEASNKFFDLSLIKNNFDEENSKWEELVLIKVSNAHLQKTLSPGESLKVHTTLPLHENVPYEIHAKLNNVEIAKKTITKYTLAHNSFRESMLSKEVLATFVCMAAMALSNDFSDVTSLRQVVFYSAKNRFRCVQYEWNITEKEALKKTLRDIFSLLLFPKAIHLPNFDLMNAFDKKKYDKGELTIDLLYDKIFAEKSFFSNAYNPRGDLAKIIGSPKKENFLFIWNILYKPFLTVSSVSLARLPNSYKVKESF